MSEGVFVRFEGVLYELVTFSPTGLCTGVLTRFTPHQCSCVS